MKNEPKKRIPWQEDPQPLESVTITLGRYVSMREDLIHYYEQTQQQADELERLKQENKGLYDKVARLSAAAANTQADSAEITERGKDHE